MTQNILLIFIKYLSIIYHLFNSCQYFSAIFLHKKGSWMSIDQQKEGKMIKNQLDIERGRRLKKLRALAGLTMNELAELAGVSRVAISYWENASPAGLSAKGAHKVVNALQKEKIYCTFEWLWEGVGEDPQYAAMKFYGGENIDSVDMLFSTSKEIEFFLRTNSQAVVVKVDNAALWPTFEFNDIVGGTWQPIAALRSEGFCIVTLNDVNQVRWVKKINKIVQLSFTPYVTSESEIEKVEMANVAPIIRVWR